MYKKTIAAFLIVFIFVGIINGFSQQVSIQLPSDIIKQFNQRAIERVKSGDQVPIGDAHDLSFLSSAGTALSLKGNLNLPVLHGGKNELTYLLSDTLFIGDTLQISGEWMRNGPVVLFGNGFLHLVNCEATILGDIYLMNESHFIAESSDLYIPQAYFYQRAVVVTGNSLVRYENTTVDHSNLSHNIVLVDSARLELVDVINKGFTTNGVYHQASVYVDGINQAGEYVIVDEASLEFHDARTVLLWHQFPETAVVDFSFPDGDTLSEYQFNSTLPGVTGVGYSILVDQCMDVMWGMMPVTGSDVIISGSEIRAIGLWFLGTDTVDVQGLVNNSSYDDFLAPLDDRSLRLKNCDLMTWSIYPMDESVVNLSGCIVGEVGTGKRSTLMGSQFFCDGSGGYVWTSDTSFMLIGYSYSNGYVRSQANSILFYAYSSLGGGYLSALQNSVIIAVQCTLPEEPRALDNGVAWYAMIDGPSEAFTGQIIDITGSVWIDKTETSLLMNFHSYHLYYQESESETWTEIPVDSLNEKRRETLGVWNTAGLDPGQYLIKIVLTDDLGNSVEGLKAISLLPSFGINDLNNDPLKIFPNPTDKFIKINSPHPGKSIKSISISDINGKIRLEHDCSDVILVNATISTTGLPAGYYFLTVFFNDGSISTGIFSKI